MEPDYLPSLVHPDDVATLEERRSRLRTATDEDVVECELRVRDSAGSWRWLQVREVVFARDGDGHPSQVVGVAKDITVRRNALAALAKSESFYRALVETLPGGVVAFDHDERITWASRKALELLAVPPGASLESLRIPDLVAPEFLPFLAERRRVLNEGARATDPAEMRFLRFDGTQFWALVSSAPVLEADGAFAGGVAVVLDTTDRHRAEEALGHRERFIERIFRATPDAMYVFDLAERRIVFENRDLFSLAGYSREEAEELRDKVLPVLLHPDDLALYEERVARFETATDEDVHETLYRLRHRDGAWRWMHGRGIVFERGSDGRPTRILAVVKDVNAQKRAEDALRESEAFHRTLTDTVPVGIAVTGEDGAVTWCSPAFRKLIAVESDAEVTGSLLTAWVVPGHEGLVVERRRDSRTPGRPVRFREVPFRRRDGSTLWADVVSSPLMYADGGFRGTIVAAQDATERRKANETVRKAAERLQELSRRVVEVQEEERRHIARELHDEIGQSLAAIHFRMQALLMAPGPVPREPIAESAEIADRTIRVVRDLSLDLHPSLLAEAGLADTLRWYVERQVRGPGLDVKLEICPSLVALPSDLRTACFRIAQSALTNVVRHAKARRVLVRIGARKGHLELVVSDDGLGFDEAATLPHASSGTSLGILGMQERAELLGGTIDFESSPGRGTTVRARFPLAQAGCGEDE